MKWPTPEFQRIVLEAIVIAALGAALGLSFHYRLILEAFAAGAPTAPAAKATERYPVPAALPEVQKLLAAGALAVDARIPELYREGHLPAAVSLPLAEVEAGLPVFRQQVAADRTLIAYCSGYGCSDSFDLAMLLLRAGYRDVRVFEGGLPQWRDAGLPVEAGP
jgi:rhodanese-related sulfurtransferase